LVDFYSTRPLQRQSDISNALKLVGIESLWATVEPNSPAREQWLQKLQAFIKRRNQIAHEGDRESARNSGKKLRAIDQQYAKDCIDFVTDLVNRVEHAFPS
jgi:hypothetical protein